MKKINYIGILLVVFTFSCKKLVQVGPPQTELTSSNLYSNNTTAASTITGMYSYMSGTSTFINESFNFPAAMSGDELNYTGTDIVLQTAYLNNFVSNSKQLFWSEA